MTDDQSKPAIGEVGARLRALIAAAEHADWQQVVLNGGPPCFHLEILEGRFCLRAERWLGHGDDHDFVSLAGLLDALLSAPVGSPPPQEKEKDLESRGGSVPGTPQGDLPRRTTGDSSTSARALIVGDSSTWSPPPEGWQPIETAPKDGTRVLIAFDWTGHVSWAHYDAQGDDEWKVCGIVGGQPTHWMPLPEPPKASAPRGGGEPR